MLNSAAVEKTADAVTASAIADGIVCQATIFKITGKSYREKNYLKTDNNPGSRQGKINTLSAVIDCLIQTYYSTIVVPQWWQDFGENKWLLLMIKMCCCRRQIYYQSSNEDACQQDSYG